MKTSPRKQEVGLAHIRLLAFLVALGFLTTGLVIHWHPDRTVRRQQEALLEAVEKAKAARIRRLMSAHYEDRWGMTPEEATDAVLEVRKHFLALALETEAWQLDREGSRATVSCRITVRGTPLGPAGGMATREINKLATPFVFTWEKESFLPSTWCLTRIDNPSLPDRLDNYAPDLP